MMTITARETRRITMTIASVMETNDMAKAFSVSVSVSAREFLNVLSTARATSAAISGTVDADDVRRLPGRRGTARSA